MTGAATTGVGIAASTGAGVSGAGVLFSASARTTTADDRLARATRAEKAGRTAARVARAKDMVVEGGWGGEERKGGDWRAEKRVVRWPPPNSIIYFPPSLTAGLPRDPGPLVRCIPWTLPNQTNRAPVLFCTPAHTLHLFTPPSPPSPPPVPPLPPLSPAHPHPPPPPWPSQQPSWPWPPPPP